ncbi:hypothetical protein TH47_18440 [Thalassospira sp. MCCC 1A02803]|nr:hypothetical protein TH47_18440 [Thalassospira sp. MCCC 1A02803]
MADISAMWPNSGTGTQRERIACQTHIFPTTSPVLNGFEMFERHHHRTRMLFDGDAQG